MVHLGRPATLAALAALSTVALPFASAQEREQETASELYFDVSTGLELYDNYESLENPRGNTTLWGNDFVLGYDSETRSETLSFRAGIRYELGEFAENPDQSSQWINPFATLNYRREASTALFRADLSYRERDNGIDLEKDFESSTDLIIDQGTRSDARGEIELALGQGTPTSATIELAYHRRRFFDTTDPDLSDQDTLRVDGELALALNRTTSLLFTAGYRDRDDLNDVNDDETLSSVGIGIETQATPDLLFRGVLRYERDERTSFSDAGQETTVEEEPTLDLSFVKDRPNGELRFALLNELNSNGVRTTAQFGRQMELPHGELDFELGATWLSNGEVTPVGSLDWQREYRRRQLGVSFSSSVTTDDDGDDILRNRLAVRFAQELTQSDGWELNANVASAGDFDNEEPDRQAAASLSYFHEINRNLSFVTGYRHSWSNGEDDDDSVTQNEIFARFDKRFSLRP